jgi:hypothetical protein
MVNGKSYTRQTIPNTELERLKKSLNAVVEVFVDEKKGRGGKVTWCRYHDNAAAGQVIWDPESMWEGVPQKLSQFLRHFDGKEGYNGNAYSLEWLKTFLLGKGLSYASDEEMCKVLEIEKEPLWFDRATWAEIVKRAGV